MLNKINDTLTEMVKTMVELDAETLEMWPDLPIKSLMPGTVRQVMTHDGKEYEVTMEIKVKAL